MVFDEFTDCDECGNPGVQRRVVGGIPVDECTYCGAIFGDPDAVERLELEREAEALGEDPRTYPLCKVLDESIKGLRTHDGHAGSISRELLPIVKFRLSGDANVMRILDRLLTSLALCNRKTKANWHIELDLERTVVFELKPRKPAGSPLDAAFIRKCRDDLRILTEMIKNHTLLTWWDIG